MPRQILPWRSYGSVDRSDSPKAIKENRQIRYYNDKHAVVADYESSIFLNVIIAETNLRESTQREESLKGQTQALGEQVRIDPHSRDAKAQSRQLEDEMKGIRKRIWHQEQELHKAEYSFPDPLQRSFYYLRKDPTWYMAPSLIEYCASRGGRCGRDCGCCKQRALSRRNTGLGHCTVECACCIRDRGFELTEEEKAEHRLNFENSLWARDPTYAVKLIMGYFELVFMDQDPASKQKRLKDRTVTEEPTSQNLAPKDSENSGSKDPPPPYGDSGNIVGDVPQQKPKSKSKKPLRFWF